MFSHVNPIRFDCDAPPYPVVRACETLGFDSPLDVRWLRMSNFLRGRAARGRTLGSNFWARLFTANRLPRPTCPCGGPLPLLEPVSFLFTSGWSQNYVMGQCGRCRTMFWDEPGPPATGSRNQWES